ncbi:LPS translocon maturation chaperone LptM [Colwellia sp. 12G3]|uniref:LPS translocon maturation chaperone LptM n=1 Tax=Colwellia sp. 12G3 TaxID=2058299 RepID=UPI000C333999|nr:lipoprotein [Colwellia sp. 12G3]PKI16341.1 hypothetical protein CXF71_08995 [Colwellia sp. 12G3]
MRTNRLHYLHKKFNFKSILLTFVAVIFLSACGIKGDLYQTPEEAVTAKDKVVEQADESEKASVKESVESQESAMITIDESEKQQTVQQSTEQTTTPSVKQPTGQVKEQQ